MRQGVLAQNLANAETPGYQRMDVDFHAQLGAAMRSGDDAKLAALQFTPQQDPRTERADGNGVDIDVEAADMAKNGLEYQALVSVARGRIDIVESALGI